MTPSEAAERAREWLIIWSPRFEREPAVTSLAHLLLEVDRERGEMDAKESVVLVTALNDLQMSASRVINTYAPHVKESRRLMLSALKDLIRQVHRSHRALADRELIGPGPIGAEKFAAIRAALRSRVHREAVEGEREPVASAECPTCGLDTPHGAHAYKRNDPTLYAETGGGRCYTTDIWERRDDLIYENYVATIHGRTARESLVRANAFLRLLNGKKPSRRTLRSGGGVTNNRGSGPKEDA